MGDLENSEYRKNIALTGLTRKGETIKPLNKREKIALNAIFLAVHNQYFLRNPELEDIGRENVTLRMVEERGTSIRVNESTMVDILGYKGSRASNKNEILDVLRGLKGAELVVDGFGIARPRTTREDWNEGFAVLVSSAYRDHGDYVIEVPSVILYRIINPEVSIRGIKDWNSFSCRYTPDIVDLLQYHFENGLSRTDWISLDELRTLLSLPHSPVFDDDGNIIDKTARSTYATFGNINKKVLQKVKADIEESPHIKFTFEIEKGYNEKPGARGRRSVDKIQFIVIKKQAKQIGRDDQIHNVQIDAWKQSLIALGIRSHQAESVIDEVPLKGDDKIEYMNWAIRKAKHYYRLTEFSQKQYNFGGFIRQNILRDKLDDWVKTWNLMKYLSEKLMLNQNGNDVHLSELRRQMEVSITERYKKVLNEFDFSELMERFNVWLSTEYNVEGNRGLKGTGQSEVDPNSEVFSYFMFFLDSNFDLYKFENFCDEAKAIYGPSILNDAPDFELPNSQI